MDPAAYAAAGRPRIVQPLQDDRSASAAPREFRLTKQAVYGHLTVHVRMYISIDWQDRITTHVCLHVRIYSSCNPIGRIVGPSEKTRRIDGRVQEARGGATAGLPFPGAGTPDSRHPSFPGATEPA